MYKISDFWIWDAHNADIPKFEKMRNLKHFWSQAVWIRDTQPVAVPTLSLPL